MDTWMWWYLGVGVIFSIGMLNLFTKAKDHKNYPVVVMAMMFIPLWGLLVAVVIIIAPFQFLYEYFVARNGT
jgi:hypothetical protein